MQFLDAIRCCLFPAFVPAVSKAGDRLLRASYQEVKSRFRLRKRWRAGQHGSDVVQGTEAEAQRGSTGADFLKRFHQL